MLENIREGVFSLKEYKGTLFLNVSIAFFIQGLLLWNTVYIINVISGQFYRLEVFALFPIVELISGLQPFTPSGVGVREGLSLVVFENIGLSAEHFAVYVVVVLYANLSRVFSGIPLLLGMVFKKRNL